MIKDTFFRRKTKLSSASDLPLALPRSGSKKSCWAYLKDLHKREQRLFTECQNSTAFRSYCILNFANLVGSLIKRYKNFVVKNSKKNFRYKISINRSIFKITKFQKSKFFAYIVESSCKNFSKMDKNCDTWHVLHKIP